MIRIAACDDEAYFREQMGRLVCTYMEETGLEYELSFYESGKKLLEESGTASHTILFLDVEMSEMDGLHTARVIRKFSKDIFIVYVTAYISYVMDGYSVNAEQYILKDACLQANVRKCLDTILEKMRFREARDRAVVRTGDADIPVGRLLYVESRLHRAVFHVMEKVPMENGQGTYTLKEYNACRKLDHVEEQLRQHGFVRVHQSFLVNMAYAIGVRRYTICLVGGHEISISKRYFRDVNTAYIEARLKV